jgi:glucuronate isomerase
MGNFKITGIMSKYIFDKNFLLFTNSAQKLYKNYVRDLPIIDYHSHLSPVEIAENKKFDSITDIWLGGDHYKWRAMRTLGVEENLITGNASALEKFKAWANCLPYTLRNPLFHWSHLELKNIFGIKEYLNPDNAEKIFERCNAILEKGEVTPNSIFKKYNVEVQCTTDDPTDDLSFHLKSTLSTKVLPTFRPDKFLNISSKKLFKEHLQKLELITGLTIKTVADLEQALFLRIEDFYRAGCLMSDHGLVQLPKFKNFTEAHEREFESFLTHEDAPAFSDPEAFANRILYALSKKYYEKGWVQMFHLGAFRNNNTRYFNRLGPDSGFDSIGDDPQARRVIEFLNRLDNEESLCRTILFNIHPNDNEIFASILGNFSSDGQKGKVQLGPGWWFMDQLDGMEKQMNALSSIGILSTFIGMTTDSRSFLSFERHDYYRRLLCNMLGKEMENGLLPKDYKWVGQIAADISYHNIRSYLDL